MTGASAPAAPHPLTRLWRYADRHRPRVLLGILWSVLNKIFDVAPEILIGFAVDVVVRGKDSFVADWLGIEDRWHQLVALGIANVVIWILESATEYAAAITWRNLAQTVQHEARLDAYTHVQRLEMSYFEDQSTGGLMSILNDDVNQLERFLDVGASQILATVVNVVIVGIVFFVVSPLIWLISFLPIPIIIGGSLIYQRRLGPLYATVRERVGELSGSLANNLGGIATIKAFTAEDREVARIAAESDAYRLANRHAIRFSSAFVPLIRMAILTAFTCTLLVGGRMALNGDMQAGTFSVLVYMTQRLLWPLTRMGEMFDLYQRAMASARRILDLLAIAPKIVSGTEALARPVRGEVVFESVAFEYGNGVDVLTDFDLHVPAGETHAIVGPTGSGKSTVVKLLLRLYEPTRGAVRVDGRDIRGLAFTELRGAMGFVSQDVFLFHGTVRENIAYGRPSASDAEVERAATLAEAHEFITVLPDGYETLVGERGQKLSGGQRQRVSIARAILRDPAILLLDEATSAVDNETEAAIQRSLDTVSRDRTTIVIAHRLSTIRGAHRIHVMERGRITEAGRHDELIELGGLYAALWRVQTGAALARD